MNVTVKTSLYPYGLYLPAHTGVGPSNFFGLGLLTNFDSSIIITLRRIRANTLTIGAVLRSSLHTV